MSLTNARFCFNNWLDVSTLQASSSLSGFSATNLVHSLRGKLWKAAGAFEISSTNCKVYIDASTYTVPTGNYTVTTLITAFNSATGKTLTRNALGRFVITSGGSCTLRLSNQTNAIWDVLGYLATTDQVGTAFTADERRYSTNEWIKTDLGLPQTPNFAAIIPPANTIFSAPLAEIRLQGNNLDTWDAPPVDSLMEVSDQGAFIAPNDLQPCRFWRIVIIDPTNSAISAAVAYIGTAEIPENTNISVGFSRNRTDQSITMFSESGALYVDRRPKVTSISSVNIMLARSSDLESLEQLAYDIGVERPFFLVIDPSKAVSSSLAKMTHYVYMTSPFQAQHVLRDYYNVSLELREVL